MHFMCCNTRPATLMWMCRHTCALLWNIHSVWFLCPLLYCIDICLKLNALRMELTCLDCCETLRQPANVKINASNKPSLTLEQWWTYNNISTYIYTYMHIYSVSLLFEIFLKGTYYAPFFFCKIWSRVSPECICEVPAQNTPTVNLL